MARSGQNVAVRVLITGADGQLGYDLAQHCAARGDDVIALNRTQLDIAERAMVHAAVASVAPDAVVNCAAWTAVDACESDPDRAMAVNGLAVRWLREASDAVGAHMVTVSTDYVFDGTKSEPYHEWDTTAPMSVYGESKLAGETEAGDRAAVVRTSWVCGAHGSNMVATVLRLLNERDAFSFVDDQRGHPTFTADLAVALRQVAVERLSGVWHLTNQGAVSWYGFVRDIVAAAGRNPDMVQPISTADLDPPRPAPRPANSVLDNRAWRLAGRAPLRHYLDPLGELVAELSRR